MRWTIRRHWWTLLAQFFAGQGAIQAINLLVGFFLLRWLSVAAYAQVSVAFAFQGTIGMLIDLGFSGSIIALAGDRGLDPAVVGRYLSSARFFRNRMMAIMAVVAVIAFPLVTARQPWPLATKALLLASVLVAIYFQGWGMYSAPLLIHRRLSAFYRSQIFSAVLRALLCWSLFAMGALNAWLTSSIAALATASNGWLYRRAAAPFLAEPERSDPECNREVLRYLSPLIPGVVFTAFQGSIVTGLITIFGRTGSIAEVAALGRLGQIFGVLTAFNSVIVAPYVARTSRAGLAPRYLLVLGGMAMLGAAFSTFAFAQPGPFLWLLGPKYAHLRIEAGWIVAVASMDFVNSGLWAMNSARKWVYWWGSAAYIFSLVLVQTVCIATLDLGQTLRVIQFSLLTSLTVFLLHIATALYGFRRGARV